MEGLPAAFPKLLSVCLALSLAPAPSARAAAQGAARDELKVVNRTRSLEVVGVERAEGSLSVTFRNNYAQPLTGLVVSVQRGTTNGLSYWGEGKALAPGATRTESFALFDGRETRELVVLAAFLQDCTIDGSPEAVREEQAQRRGEKAQNEKLLALVTRTLDSPKFDPRRSLEELERDLHRLAELTSRSPREEGHSRRVSHSTFVWARVMDIGKALKADKAFDVRAALTQLRNSLEARRNSC